jgi:prevent-host-death family protein
VVTKHGEEVAVVVSIEDYRRLTEELPSFKEFLLAAPDRLVPITADVCEEWGRLNVPDPLPVVDGLMAATAKVRGWTFVTRNVADLARADVRLLNPFD